MNANSDAFHDESLPEDANIYLRSALVTHRKSTVSGYRSTLRAFYPWLKANDIALSTISRTQITRWFSEIKESGKSASCIAARVIHLRMYFLWLSEEGLLNEHPFHLVRTRDIPRLPQYLPKPLPPDIDKTLQERLERSDCLCRQGLLLMRKTGIRIGELTSLPLNCVVSDNDNHSFLKVPLGKLNNERLVPLDESALCLVKKLQQRNADQKKQLLLEDEHNKKVPYCRLAKTLRRAVYGLELDAKVTPHRLRHTFATSLLNAGMSLLSLMKILGHRSYRMTLRYAAVTHETVSKEYYKALLQLESKYAPAFSQRSPIKTDPAKMLSDIISLLKSHAAENPSNKRNINAVVKRIHRLQKDLYFLSVNS